MSRTVPLLFSATLAVLCLPQSVGAQASVTPSDTTAQQVSGTPLTIQVYSRMVNLDVVVKDSKGNHIRGLKAEDFRVFEQTLSKNREKREQKIAAIREIHTVALKPPGTVPVNPEPGVYTNALAIAAQEEAVPPTVLVVDGVNTELQYQAQVHVQMMRILRQLPPNVPVAVLLMGTRLSLLQGFTTDPKLLQQALAKAVSVVGQGEHLAPQDDPDNPATLTASLLGGASDKSMAELLQSFSSATYTGTSARRIRMTLDMFISIAQSLSGYPGRKNLLWMSTSFPVTNWIAWALANNPHPGFDNNEEIPRHMQILNNALSDARVAVYPVNVAGVTTLQVFSAAARPADSYAGSETSYDALRVAGAASRQAATEYSEQTTMYDLAEGTGGKVCTGDNDLGDCVRKAVDDSSDFYEISYYPDSSDWNGEYRRILLNVKGHGTHVSYRQGYYAINEGDPAPQIQQAEMQDHCGDLLNATGVQFTARSLPADSRGGLKFSLLIDASTLSLLQAADGNQQLETLIGVCTYDEKGSPLKSMTFPSEHKLDAKQLDTLSKTGQLSEMISVPGPKPAAVRLLVKDVVTGSLGSIHIWTRDAMQATLPN